MTSQVIWQAAIGSEAQQTTTINYTYDREGKLISKSLDGLQNTYNYSPGGTLDSVDYWEANVKKTIKFATDDRGRRTDTWYGADANTSADNWEVWKHSDFDRSGNLIGEKVQKAKSAPVSAANPKGVGTLTEKKYCYVPGVDPRSCPTDATNAVDKIQAMYTANMATGTGFVTSYAYLAVGLLFTVPGAALAPTGVGAVVAGGIGGCFGGAVSEAVSNNLKGEETGVGDVAGACASNVLLGAIGGGVTRLAIKNIPSGMD